LRDWLFSRQRYWGEPFPIVYDETDLPIGVLESMLPVRLPDMDDFRPQQLDPDDQTSEPIPPLARADYWATVELDLGDGPKTYRRELNVMPQWAGSCYYELRYLDPTNENELVDPAVERYWMGPKHPGDVGGVDLYVGGVEHAVLHLLYARFWHKVLFDLGHVSSEEPYYRLFNQGYIQAYAFRDARGQIVESGEVSERDGHWYHDGNEVVREHGKMGKSLKNVVTPDDMYDAYGADTFRVYEMSTGPLDASRPWNTRDVIGMYRFLQRVWRNVVDEQTGELIVGDDPPDLETRKLLHRTMQGVANDFAALRFNTAIAKVIELNNRLTRVVTEKGTSPREVIEPMLLMMAPLTPHLTEELWSRLGHDHTLTYEPFPEPDPALLVEDSIELPVQINGKVRGHIDVSPTADAATIEATAFADAKVQAALDGRTPTKVIVVPGRMVNLVV
jgi:leucyl-tRNA synthetase